MAGSVVVLAIMVFLAGMLAGGIAAAVVAVRREDRRYSLSGEAPGRLGILTRRRNGLGHRDPHIPPGGPLPH
jgi:hypothetical protein